MAYRPTPTDDRNAPWSKPQQATCDEAHVKVRGSDQAWERLPAAADAVRACARTQEAWIVIDGQSRPERRGRLSGAFVGSTSSCKPASAISRAPGAHRRHDLRPDGTSKLRCQCPGGDASKSMAPIEAHRARMLLVVAAQRECRWLRASFSSYTTLDSPRVTPSDWTESASW